MRGARQGTEESPRSTLRTFPSRVAQIRGNAFRTLSITDGPFVETKEQLAGFYLIEARDLNDAISGSVEDSAGARVEHRSTAELNPALHR